MKKYTLDEFLSKYTGKRGICCGINYEDGDRDTMINASCSQIVSLINQKGKSVNYIASK